MMNKRGEVVLRDVMFLLLIVSSIFVLAGLFVSEMAFNYQNTEMTAEWAVKGTNTISNSTFFDTSNSVATTGKDLESEDTGLYRFISGALDALEGIGKTLVLVLNAPNTIASLVTGMLVDAGVPSFIGSVIQFLITSVFWIIIIFTIISAFLKGGKL